MVINALNCGANIFMADFGGRQFAKRGTTTSTTQMNMRDAIRRTIEFTSPEGESYKLNDKIATLLVRRAAGIWTKSMYCWAGSRSPAP